MKLPVSFVRLVFLLESSPRPIAFQACESRIHEIPGQGFRELKESGAYAVPIAIRPMTTAVKEILTIVTN